MRKHQSGFTMIELIIVIVILGVLAAAALPRFINMRGDAEQAAIDGIAGAANSAMNINYSGCSLANNIVTANKCAKINLCSDVSSILQGGLPAAYTVGPNAVGTEIGTDNIGTATCRLSKVVGSNTYTATFTGLSAGN